jgi:hypothetical protein
VLQGVSLEEVVASVARDIRRTRDDGGRVPETLARTWTVLHQERAAVREAREAVARALAAPPDDATTMTLREAVDVLPIGERQVRRDAVTKYGGRKWLGAWALDRELVEADVRARTSVHVRR